MTVIFVLILIAAALLVGWPIVWLLYAAGVVAAVFARPKLPQAPKPPTSLDRAKRDYVTGRITLDEFEHGLDDVLAEPPPRPKRYEVCNCCNGTGSVLIARATATRTCLCCDGRGGTWKVVP